MKNKAVTMETYTWNYRRLLLNISPHFMSRSKNSSGLLKCYKGKHSVYTLCGENYRILMIIYFRDVDLMAVFIVAPHLSN